MLAPLEDGDIQEIDAERRKSKCCFVDFDFRVHGVDGISKLET